jgi:hypothetical protein
LEKYMNIVSPCKSGRLDAPTFQLLKEVSIDIPIVLMNCFSDYQFNPALYDLDRYIIADFCELGANTYDRSETLLFGRNAERFKKTDSEEWRKFDQFVKDKPPLLIFKRELLKKDFGGNVYPIDFPCYINEYPLQTEAEFNARPLSVAHFWGWSHESRRVLQGNIYLNAAQKDIVVIDNFNHIIRGIQEYKNYKQIWATINVPWFDRIPMEQLYYIQGMAKLSVSLPGAGAKCFRMTEACVNSTMIMQDDKMQYSYPWINGENCIQIPLGEDHKSIRGLKGGWDAIETIEAALQRDDLYSIYKASVANCDKYRIKNYVTNYIEPIIKQHL